MVRKSFVVLTGAAMLFLFTVVCYAGTWGRVSCSVCGFDHDLYFGPGMEREEMTIGYCQICVKFVSNEMIEKQVEDGWSIDNSGKKEIFYRKERVDNDICPLCGRRPIIILAVETLREEIRELSCPRCHQKTLWVDFGDWD